jgi:hypothetical protein
MRQIQSAAFSAIGEQSATLSPDFLVASGTILPVITIAVLAEARESVKAWRNEKDETSAWAKTAISLMWTLFLTLSSFVTPMSLISLAGRKPGTWFVIVAVSTATLGMISIAVLPMGHLLATAKWRKNLALRLASPRARWKRHRLERQIEDNLDRGRWLTRFAWKELVRNSIELCVSERRLAKAEMMGSPLENREVAKIELKQHQLTQMNEVLKELIRQNREQSGQLVTARDDLREAAKVNARYKAWLDAAPPDARPW